MEKFEAESHFRCFPFEQSPSFSANCNVLLAFLHTSEPSLYLPQILKCVRYLCYEWWNTDEPIKDKWVCPLKSVTYTEFIPALPLTTRITELDSTVELIRKLSSRNTRATLESQSHGRPFPNSLSNITTTK